VAQDDERQAHDHPIDAAEWEPDLTALELLGEYLEVHRARKDEPLGRAIRNELWVHGEQFSAGAFDDGWGETEWGAETPQFKRNGLSWVHATWTSRFLERRPTVKFWPRSAGGGEPEKVEVMRLVQKHVEHKHQFDAMLFGAVDDAQCGGLVGFYTTWNPLDGPPSQGVTKREAVTYVDEETGEEWTQDEDVIGEDGEPVLDGVGEPEGDVSIEVLTVHEFWTATGDLERDTWLVVESYVDVHEARAIVAGAELDGVDPALMSPQTYENAFGEQCEGVPCHYVWVKPCARIPEGVYFHVVDGKVVKLQPYPYAHGELPISIFYLRQRRGSFFGSTHVNDAVPIQREINEMTSIRAQRARKLAETYLLASKKIIDAMDQGGGRIEVDDQPVAEWLEAPQVPTTLLTEIADAKDGVLEAYGLNAMVTGSQPLDEKVAGKSIAYVNQLDAMKVAGCARALQACLVRLWRQVIALYQQHVSHPRLLEVVGEDRAVEALMFQGAMLEGMDVYAEDIHLEPSDGIDSWHASEAERALAAAAAGAEPPARAMERASTGLTQTSADAITGGVLDEQIEAWLSGAPAMPDPRVAPAVAERRLVAAIAANEGNPAVDVLIEALVWYRNQALQQPGAAPPEQEQSPGVGPGGVPIE